MKTLALVATLAVGSLLVFPALSQASYMGNIQLTHPSPAHLPHGELAYVTFDYKVDNPEGVRFMVQPWSEGAIEQGYAWSGSVVYTGTGTTSKFFTFHSGDHHVDQYRLAMWTPDWSENLLEIFIRVDYTWGEHGVFNIVQSHSSPSWLGYGQHMSVTFDYESSNAAGVRISARPFTDGALTPSYHASSVPTLPPSGSASQWFYFDEDRQVDQIRFQMWNPDFSELLLEFFLPVDLYWRSHGIGNITMTPSSPSMVPHYQHVDVEFDFYNYSTDGFLVFARGMQDGEYPPGWAYQASGPIYDNEGHTSRYWYQTSGEPVIDEVQILVKSADATETYLDARVPVEYVWGPNAVYNVDFTPTAPAILDNEEHVDLTFDYTWEGPDDCLIFQVPYTDGAPSPNYAVSGSIYYPPPSGSGNDYFTILTGDLEVDQVRYKIMSTDFSITYFEYLLSAQHFFGSSGTITPVIDVPDPVLVALGQNYPNPFNPATTIPVFLDEARRVRLQVYDLRGRLIATVADQVMSQGYHEIEFYADRIPSGTYFYTLDTGGLMQTKQMLLLK